MEDIFFTEDAADLLAKYSFEEYGELQSIAVQRHWMDNQGLVGVELEGFNGMTQGLRLHG